MLKTVEGKLSLVMEGFNPLSVDFSEGALGYRVKKTSGKSELLFKAVGGMKNQKILDATAGLGRDSFLLAHLGFQVEAFEKNPTVFSLLKDGYERGLENPALAPALLRLKFLYQDFLKETPRGFDVIYLDPMFPDKTKSSLPKKEMQLLQNLTESEKDNSLEMLQWALKSKDVRVVLKRPLRSPILIENPVVQFKGNSIRYDVYKS